MKLITLDEVYEYFEDMKKTSEILETTPLYSFNFWQYCEHIKKQGYKIL